LNWFEILKNTGLAQSQRQGFRLDDKDEDYVLEEENDCQEKLIAFFKKTCENLKFKPIDLSDPEKIAPIDINYEQPNLENLMQGGFIIVEDISDFTDDQFCTILEEFKKFVDYYILNFSKDRLDFTNRKVKFKNNLEFKIYRAITRHTNDITFRVELKGKMIKYRYPLRFRVGVRYLESLMGGESNNEDTQKAAGAVTSSTPGIHRVRYSPKKKKEEDE
tara:strand:- start:340 stop:996 length:657 start_codon:yes stop_codon:yes gene_type:complete